MPDFVLGKDAKAYFVATADSELAAMSEVANMMDVTLDLSKSETDITTRGNSGFRATASALKELSADFKMIWKPGDAFFTAVQAAWYSDAALCMAFLDGGKSVSGSQGPRANFTVTNFKRNEPLDGPITVDVTVKCSKFLEWEVVGAS